jgi:hypothetical protein
MNSIRIDHARRHRVAGRGPSLRRPTAERPPPLPEWARARKPSRIHRFNRWSPPWWFQSIFIAILVGGLLGITSISLQQSISAASAKLATRLENLRFVRQLSSEPSIVARPFSGFDLEGQNLAGLDLTGAQLDNANLRHATLHLSDLRPGPPMNGVPFPQYSNLTRADLTGANLGGANLTLARMGRANLTDAELLGAKPDRRHTRRRRPARRRPWRRSPVRGRPDHRQGAGAAPPDGCPLRRKDKVASWF